MLSHVDGGLIAGGDAEQLVLSSSIVLSVAGCS